ncbi:MAG: PSD1 domain-containing protein [Pirellulaceae bacterium]|nr:PSD1 domain-containing protein [Pirellulaceae bacterium]
MVRNAFGVPLPLLPLCLLLLLCVMNGAVAADEQHVSPDARHTFERDVRPILKTWCLDCHGAAEQLEGGLDLRLRRFLVRGGDSGPAVVPGKTDDSYLLERVRSGEMPPGEKKLPAASLAVLEQWIEAGAPTARAEPETLAAGVAITEEERAFWSFQPIRRPAVPAVEPAAQVHSPIDAFLLQRMAPSGLSFSPEADRRTLIRRASLDLLGLPPSKADVERFLADESPEAYEALIDRLLQSPHYGERWARHWLDVAGYADSEGYTNADADRPWAWQYRDYVIRALNADKPFDQFLIEQLAGDELVPPPQGDLTAEQIERLTATGFLRMAADGTGSGASDDAARNQTIADTLKIVSTSLLGLSVGCAQCHDHRYDPIPHRDYYQLRAVFEPALNWKQWRTPQQRLVSLYTAADRQRAAEVEAEANAIAAEKNEKQRQYLADALTAELAKFDESLRGALRAAYEAPADQRTDEQQALLKMHPSVNISAGTLYQYNQQAADELKKYDERIAEVRRKKPAEQFLRVLNEVPGQVPETRIFHRGELNQPLEVVGPAALSITAPPGERWEIAAKADELPTTGRRLAYARWLTSGRHPLVARVLVNRVWLHHFGRGIVGTPSDFGVLGQRPTHPELLDWLAAEFMEQGWSLKKLHKRIMTSTAYRQSAAADPGKLALDPDNSLYWKWPVQRLDAEVVRDGILAASGALSDRMFGPPVAVQPDDAGQVVVPGEDTRRSIYIQVKRTQPLAVLQSFDAPVMETNCERRASSTVATQALMLMNSEFMLQQARRMAQRVEREGAASTAAADEHAGLLDRAWQLAFCREIGESERRAAEEFLARQVEQIRAGGNLPPDTSPELLALTCLCQVLLSSNEFLYVD